MRSQQPASKRKTQPAPAKKPAETPHAKDAFPIVGIGASAGGLEAFTELLRHLPVNTGMAFVFIQHLDPKHHSILTELVGKETKMPVVEVKNGMVVQPDHVYVIPPNANMAISNRNLTLTPRRDTPGQHMPVDHFMRSLAEDQGNKAIGVILSGTGSDGTLGLAEIQAQGGVTFAQEEQSAKYDGMPRSAIAAACVDFVLAPKGIAGELARIGRHPYVIHPKVAEAGELVPEGEPGLNTVFALLRKAAGVDFTYYRHTTTKRRIHRRMVVHKIEKLEDYIKYLQQNPAEVKALCQDILINVTSFFRNPGAFEALKHVAFPVILKNRAPGAPIRIWAPGCASGEEAYSLAIALLEFLGDRATHIPIQLFGTDLSEVGIAKARAGFYPENIQADVSPERLRRFFVKAEGGYVISKTIRDMCIFAQHNILSDPPFSQTDLISCRNLLIYLEPILQKKVLALLHYGLRPSGFLILGTSEGVGTSSNLFSAEDKVHKIYSKRWTPAQPMVSFPLGKHFARVDHVETGKAAPKPAEPGEGQLEAQKEFDRRLLMNHVPAAVFIDADMQVVHSRGNIDRYFKLPPGRASLNVLKMAREGLLFDLQGAVHGAQKENTPVRKENVQVKNGSQVKEVNFEVIPVRVASANAPYLMIVFEDIAPSVARKPEAKLSMARSAEKDLEAANRRIVTLEQELAASKEYLQSVVGSLEATNEQMQSANEEILSGNEELQSTNEELETAKEELQSTNEELTTVNEELRNRNLEVTQINNDLTNLLSSVNIAIVMLGNDMCIRRFTPLAQKLLGLIPTDVGRPITSINPTVGLPDLQQMISKVMETFSVAEREVQDRNGGWYSLRILPYRTLDNKVDGVVITLADMREKAELLNLAYDAILVRDTDDAIRFWNHGAEELYGWKANEAIGKVTHELLKTRFPISQEDAHAKLFQQGRWEGELIHTTRDGRQIVVSGRWTLKRDEHGEPTAVLEINRDITEHKKAEVEVHQLSGRLLRLQDQERRRLARELHDATGQKVAALTITLDALAKTGGEQVPPKVDQALGECRNLAHQISEEIRTLAYLLHPPLLDEVGLASAIRWYTEGLASRSGIQMDIKIPPKLPRLPEEVEIALFRVVQESLTNVHLHSGSKKARLAMTREDDRIALEISDEGCGIAPEIMDRMGSRARDVGVGLAGMRERVQQLGGHFNVLSSRKGTTVQATIPIKK